MVFKPGESGNLRGRPKGSGTPRAGGIKSSSTDHGASKVAFKKYKIASAVALTLYSSDTCWCCGTSERGNKRWYIDHCHETGKIRGVVCHLCNMFIGTSKGAGQADNLAALETSYVNAKRYLLQSERSSVEYLNNPEKQKNVKR